MDAKYWAWSLLSNPRQTWAFSFQLTQYRVVSLLLHIINFTGPFCSNGLPLFREACKQCVRMWHKPNKPAHAYTLEEMCILAHTRAHTHNLHCLDCGNESSASTGISWTATGWQRDAQSLRGSARPHDSCQYHTKHLKGFMMKSCFVSSALSWEQGQCNVCRNEIRRSQRLCGYTGGNLFRDLVQKHKYNTLNWFCLYRLNQYVT